MPVAAEVKELWLHSLFEALMQVWQNGKEGQMGQATPEHCKWQMESWETQRLMSASVAGCGSTTSQLLLNSTHTALGAMSSCPGHCQVQAQVQ
jgi:hypothetical protein